MDNLEKLIRQEDYEALYKGAIFPVIFTALMYIFGQDNTPLLTFTFLFTFFYITSLLSAIRLKERLFYMLPITSKQFIQIIYKTVMKNLSILYVVYSGIYVIVLKFSKVGLNGDDVAMYVEICCLSFLIALLCIFLHFKIERAYTTVVQFTALILSVLGSSILFVGLEKIGLPFVSCSITIVITIILSIILYKLTIKTYIHYDMR